MLDIVKKNFVFFVFCNIVATLTRTGHTGFILAQSFPAAFASSFPLVVKAFCVLHGEFLTGFNHNFKKELAKVFYKKGCS